MGRLWIVVSCGVLIGRGGAVGETAAALRKNLGINVPFNLVDRRGMTLSNLGDESDGFSVRKVLGKSYLPGIFPFSNYFPAKSGICHAGQTFAIQSESDLKAQLDQLECVWAAAGAPEHVPQGFLKGFVLLFLNSESTNDKMQSFWQGKQAQTTQCSGSDTTFQYATNMVTSDFAGPSLPHTLPCLLYIGKPLDVFAEGEHMPKSERSLFCDYTVDWSDICRWEAGQSGAADFRSWNTNGFASNSYDMLRVVGRTEDGAWLLLGRSMVRDIYSDKGSMTASWWYVISYDEVALADFSGTIGPLSESFEYRHGGSLDYFKRVAPIEAAASHPLLTFERFAFAHFLRPSGYGAPYGLARGAKRPRAGISVK